MEFTKLDDLVAAARARGISVTGRGRDEIAADLSRLLGRGIVCNFTHASASARGLTNPRPKNQ